MIGRVVEQVLRLYPETRDSDKKCLIKVWEHCGLYLSETQKDKFMGIASPETIRRSRQKLQESGKYPASERIRKQRKFKAMRVQQMVPAIKPDRVDNLVNRVEQQPLFESKTSKRFEML